MSLLFNNIQDSFFSSSIFSSGQFHLLCGIQKVKFLHWVDKIKHYKTIHYGRHWDIIGDSMPLHTADGRFWGAAEGGRVVGTPDTLGTFWWALSPSITHTHTHIYVCVYNGRPWGIKPHRSIIDWTSMTSVLTWRWRSTVDGLRCPVTIEDDLIYTKNLLNSLIY